MESSPASVLVVANRTAATPQLLAAVRARAAAGPCRFTLLVPKAASTLHRLIDAEDVPLDASQAVLDDALPRLSEAAGAPVDGMVGVAEPLAAIQDAVNLHHFDEIILSTLPARVSRWLHIDLPSKARGLGLPLTLVSAEERAPAPA